MKDIKLDLDDRLKPLVEEWKEKTGMQIRCQNDNDDFALCPECDSQLFFCDCSQIAAQKILELQFGFDDFND